MAQIPGKAGACFGGQHRAEHTEGKGGQGAQHQLHRFDDHNGHILPHDAVIVQIRHHQRNQHLHGHLPDHAHRAEEGGPFVLPDTPGQSFDHLL